jgi:hypothetical protein
MREALGVWQSENWSTSGCSTVWASLIL